jgi:hypothetical protein
MSPAGAPKAALVLSNIFYDNPQSIGGGQSMIAILIGAGLAGVVLGATSRIVFLLPAMVMAIMVTAILIVRVDIDLGFAALAATLLNAGFLLGIVMASMLPALMVSLRPSVDEIDASFIVRDH